MIHDSIVLSGLPGSGKSSLVKELKRETGWPFHSIGDLFREKHRHLQDIGEVSKDLRFEYWWPTVPDDEQIKVNEDLLKLLNQGGIITDTRYAFYLKQSIADPLFVYLKADLSIRASRAINNPYYLGKNISEISDMLLKREEDEVNMGLKLFGKDYRDLKDFNLVLDSGKLSVDEEVSEIMKYLR